MDSTYYVQNGDETIYTTVTANPDTVTDWIQAVNNFFRLRQTVIFGLDVEWKPNRRSGEENPVATLQIGVGVQCLIVQLIHIHRIPPSLRRLLRNPRYVFAGVDVGSDAGKLMDDYGLICENLYELRAAAREMRRERSAWSPGLKELASEVAGVCLEKPRRVAMSDWGKVVLTQQQVEYACLDAYASMRVGFTLYFDLEWGQS